MEYNTNMNTTKWQNRPESYQKQSREHALQQGLSSLYRDTTNAEFAKNNKTFRKACEAVDIEPTPRQASKYRRKMGVAFKGV